MKEREEGRRGIGKQDERAEEGRINEWEEKKEVGKDQ